MPMQRLSLHDLLDELASEQDLLLVQDLDGVCMPLVRDPLTRTLDRWERSTLWHELGHSCACSPTVNTAASVA